MTLFDSLLRKDRDTKNTVSHPLVLANIRDFLLSGILQLISVALGQSLRVTICVFDVLTEDRESCKIISSVLSK